MKTSSGTTMNLKGIQFLTLCFLFCISVGDARAPRKVIQGEFAEVDEIPYQVYIRNIWTGASCGGVILDATHILTAAHCVVSKYFQIAKPESIRVSTGFIDGVDGDYYNVFTVAEITPHENYNNPTIDRQIKLFADIAILKLSENIVFTVHERPINLTSSEVPVDSEVVASGWGISEYVNGVGITARWLQKLNMTTVSLDACKQAHHNIVTDGQICAMGDRSTGLCFGDSGGPLTYNNQLIGIVSWGQPCAVRGYPDVFTSVHYYHDWINSVMQRHC